MAKSDKTPAGRQVVAVGATKPSHLASKGGPGKTRTPTEFDDLIPTWYESGEWFKIPASGDSDEEQLADMDEVFKAVNKAASYHNLGIDRVKENDPTDENFTGFGVVVRVRDRQARGPKKGSLKDPNTGERISPDDETGRYQELLQMRENGEI